MSWVVGIIGLLLIGAWIEQTLMRRWRARRWMRLRNELDKWCDYDDGPEGDY